MKKTDEQKEIEMLINNAKDAEIQYESLNQEKIDKIIKAMSIATVKNHMKLAKMAVEETGRGVYEDKITKNMFSSEYIS